MQHGASITSLILCQFIGLRELQVLSGLFLYISRQFAYALHNTKNMKFKIIAYSNLEQLHLAFTHRIDRETYNEHLKLEVGEARVIVFHVFLGRKRLSIKTSSGDNFIKILKLMCMRPDWPEGRGVNGSRWVNAEVHGRRLLVNKSTDKKNKTEERSHIYTMRPLL